MIRLEEVALKENPDIIVVYRSHRESPSSSGDGMKGGFSCPSN